MEWNTANRAKIDFMGKYVFPAYGGVFGVYFARYRIPSGLTVEDWTALWDRAEAGEPLDRIFPFDGELF